MPGGLWEKRGPRLSAPTSGLSGGLSLELQHLSSALQEVISLSFCLCLSPALLLNQGECVTWALAGVGEPLEGARERQSPEVGCEVRQR